LPAADQRRFAELYISAFLAASLRGDTRYLALFRDHRTAADWLPKTMYVTRLQHASFRPLATFEEDVDVAHGEPGVQIRGDSLAVWKESGLNLRTSSEGATMNNWVLTIGWNNRIAGEDTTRTGPPAVLELALSDSLRTALALTERHSLDFLLMPTADLPGPRADPDTTKAAADSMKKKTKTPPKPKQKDDKEEKPPVDLSVQLVDDNGISATLPLSRYGAIRRPLEMSILRRQDREKTAYPRRYELVMQSFSIRLADFLAASTALDIGRIRSVRFVFDRALAGTVLLDDVGFSQLPAGFWN